jgi:D-lyxose ketol-isomerase
MITEKEHKNAQKKALKYLKRSGIILNSGERGNIEVTDFGLGNLQRFGLQIVTYVNTERCCAKELVLFPWQICPEHLHPDIDWKPGKEETFRCRWGVVYLFVPGEKTPNPHIMLPDLKYRKYLTVWKEIILKPGEQYTIFPNTKHWFCGGKRGAVISEFSTTSYDERDSFTDPRVDRITKIRKV